MDKFIVTWRDGRVQEVHKSLLRESFIEIDYYEPSKQHIDYWTFNDPVAPLEPPKRKRAFFEFDHLEYENTDDRVFYFVQSMRPQ